MWLYCSPITVRRLFYLPLWLLPARRGGGGTTSCGKTSNFCWMKACSRRYGKVYDFNLITENLACCLQKWDEIMITKSTNNTNVHLFIYLFIYYVTDCRYRMLRGPPSPSMSASRRWTAFREVEAETQHGAPKRIQGSNVTSWITS
jgi:hypothetical protein